MIPIVVTIVSYDKEKHKCKAIHHGNCLVDLDPFVGCAISMTDEDYNIGKGNDLVGKQYRMTIYTVYNNEIVPHEGGLTLINN